MLAVAFHGAIVLASAALIGKAVAQPGWLGVALTIGCPTLGGLAAGLFLHYGFPNARGSGIPQVKAAYAVQTARLRLRDGIAKFGTTVLQLGSGTSLGREGPTVQICASLASALGRWFALSPRSVRRLMPVGAAAGVAAAFNAPIAAVTFTVEEVVGALDQTVLSGVVVAAALAAIIEHTILGAHPILTLTHSVRGLEHASALPFYALLGILAGLLSVAFTRSLLRLRRGFRAQGHVPAWAQPAVGGLATGICAVVGYLTVGEGGVLGGGYEQLSGAINESIPLQTLIALGGLKFIATIFSYSSGSAGGLFAPTLFLGAMLGGVVGWIDVSALGQYRSNTFALVGMGAAFAGIIRAPITSVLIIFEMTGGYGLVLPLMLANTCAYVVARKMQPLGLYDALLAQDGIRLMDATGSGQLGGLCVKDGMNTDLHTLGDSLTVTEALQSMARDAYSVYPVITGGGRCLGLVNRARAQRVIAEGGGDRSIADLVRLKEYLYAEDPMLRAVVRMSALGTRQLPVVSERDMQLIGLITMSDIFATQARVAQQQGVHPDSPRSAGPPSSQNHSQPDA